MSVIENALNKLQAARSAQARDQATAVETERPASAAIADGNARKRAPGPPDAPPRRMVRIDLNKLRGTGLLPPENEDRYLARQFRQIKRPLLANALGRGVPRMNRGNLIMMASAMPGEGKTFTSINLAFSMRLEKDLTVLLVDGDVARPQLSEQLGIGAEAGLLDVLRNPNTDVESAILATDIPGLYVLPAGRPSENTTELLASALMEQVSTRLGDRDPSRIVIFDSSPLLLTTESHALVHLMGQVVVVVRATHTPRHALDDALQFIGTDKPVSLVLNQSIRARNSKYYYSYDNDESNESSRSP